MNRSHVSESPFCSQTAVKRENEMPLHDGCGLLQQKKSHALATQSDVVCPSQFSFPKEKESQLN
nr:hypothetical protein [uncultured bacterium]